MSSLERELEDAAAKMSARLDAAAVDALEGAVQSLKADPSGGGEVGPAISELLRLSVQYGREDLAALMAALVLMRERKQAREDRAGRREERQRVQLALLAAAAKLELDNKSIDMGLDEAGEKAEAAMEAATIALATGIISATGAVGDSGALDRDAFARLLVQREGGVDRLRLLAELYRARAQEAKSRRDKARESIVELLKILSEIQPQI